MIKRNVYLVDMGTGSNMNMLQLAICLVGSYSVEQPEIKEYFNLDYRFLTQGSKVLVDSLEDPAIVGLSSYIWNFRRALVAARAIKTRFPNALIVLGGASVPRRPDRISELFRNHPQIDFLVHGEGELTFANLLRQYMDKQQFHDVKGLTVRIPDVKDGFISHPHAYRVDCLDDLPSPFLNGTFDKILRTYGSKITGALWETNRGCPYRCTFCEWGDPDINKVKKYSLERIYEEIKWISKNDFYYMQLADANFGIFAERDLEIAGYIADLHIKNGSPHHVITNWAKNKGKHVVDVAERLAKGDVACNITMSIQSTNPETLKIIKRRNLEQGKINSIKSMFHDSYIPTYVEVILGLPLETYETFSKGLNTILSNRLEDRFFMYLCQMLENAELSTSESREKYQLDTRFCRHTINNRTYDWEKWNEEETEYEEFVIGTSTMPTSDYKKAYVLGYFLTVLYNHRSVFFPFIYLKEEFGVLPVDLIEFIISRLRQDPSSFPVLNRSINHLDNQVQLMIDGVSTMSGLPIPEAEGLVVLAHVGSLVLLVCYKEDLYEELGRMFNQFFADRQFDVDPLIFEEVLIYQKMRFQGWPQKPTDEYHFQTNIPEYFLALTAGSEAPPIQNKPISVIFQDHERKVDTLAEFVAILVRGGLTVDLLAANIQDMETTKSMEEEILFEKRILMEQTGLDKLKLEFDKLSK